MNSVDERPDEQRDREQLPVQEGAVRLPVHDVERRLEHAEQRERSPAEEEGADHAERRGVVLHRAHDADDALDGARRERLVQLGHEVARLVGAAGEAEEREREEDQWDEREKREIGDHRGEVRPSVCEKLAEDLPHRAGG